jgi:hypothetical protein
MTSPEIRVVFEEFLHGIRKTLAKVFKEIPNWVSTFEHRSSGDG